MDSVGGAPPPPQAESRAHRRDGTGNGHVARALVSIAQISLIFSVTDPAAQAQGATYLYCDNHLHDRQRNGSSRSGPPEIANYISSQIADCGLATAPPAGTRR
jgi:hypothetical protein